MTSAKPIFQTYIIKKFFGILLFVTVLSPLVANATIPVDSRDIKLPSKVIKSSDDILAVQKALSKLGLYVGPEHGQLTKETIAAIKFYQRSTTLEPDGQITKRLINKLNYALNIRRLMKRLDQTRKKSIKTARSKLLLHPATRKLILGEKKIEIADPTRDPVPCFMEPTADCLLAEARESAKAIGRNELRDWALGEILIVQARAGLGDDAYNTTSRIRDPRLIIVALGDIADARAAAGDPEAAIGAAMLIPDNEKRAKALISISEIQGNRGDIKDTKKTLVILLKDLAQMSTIISRINFLSRAAIVYNRIGAIDNSKKILDNISFLIKTLPKKEAMGPALRYFSSALLRVGDILSALEVLKRIKRETDRIPVFLTLAEVQASKGDWKEAIKTAKKITNDRFQAVALGRIAAKQIAHGNTIWAELTLTKAIKTVQKIKRPYAKSYAISHLAIETSRLHLHGHLNKLQAQHRALELANQIFDPRLKARSLWMISAQYNQIGYKDGAIKFARLARTATFEITSRLSQVWMFSNLASTHAHNGNFKVGWVAFHDGLEIAKNIKNSWNRARTLAKLAATMIILVDPGRGLGPISE